MVNFEGLEKGRLVVSAGSNEWGATQMWPDSWPWGEMACPAVPLHIQWVVYCRRSRASSVQCFHITRSTRSILTLAPWLSFRPLRSCARPLWASLLPWRCSATYSPSNRYPRSSAMDACPSKRPTHRSGEPLAPSSSPKQGGSGGSGCMSRPSRAGPCPAPIDPRNAEPGVDAR